MRGLLKSWKDLLGVGPAKPQRSTPSHSIKITHSTRRATPHISRRQLAGPTLRCRTELESKFRYFSTAGISASPGPTSPIQLCPRLQRHRRAHGWGFSRCAAAQAPPEQEGQIRAPRLRRTSSWAMAVDSEQAEQQTHRDRWLGHAVVSSHSRGPGPMAEST